MKWNIYRGSLDEKCLKLDAQHRSSWGAWSLQYNMPGKHSPLRTGDARGENLKCCKCLNEDLFSSLASRYLVPFLTLKDMKTDMCYTNFLCWLFIIFNQQNPRFKYGSKNDVHFLLKFLDLTIFMLNCFNNFRGWFLLALQRSSLIWKKTF